MNMSVLDPAAGTSWHQPNYGADHDGPQPRHPTYWCSSCHVLNQFLNPSSVRQQPQLCHLVAVQNTSWHIAVAIGTQLGPVLMAPMISNSIWRRILTSISAHAHTAAPQCLLCPVLQGGRDSQVHPGQSGPWAPSGLAQPSLSVCTASHELAHTICRPTIVTPTPRSAMQTDAAARITEP